MVWGYAVIRVRGVNPLAIEADDDLQLRLIGPRRGRRAQQFLWFAPRISRSSAGVEIEAISGTWMPSRSRTRITTRTRVPTRSCRSSGEEIDFGIDARYSNELLNPRAATVRYPYPVALHRAKRIPRLKTAGPSSSANVITANKRSGRSTVRTSTTDALYSPALGPTISSEKGPFFHRRPRNGRCRSLRAPASRSVSR